MTIIDGVVVFRTSIFTGQATARSFGLFICVPEGNHEDLIKHEIQHCIDWRNDVFRYSYNYLFNWQYRLWAELRGYAHNKDSTSMITHFLNGIYNFPRTITTNHVRALMKHCSENSWDNSKLLIESVI